MQKQPVLGVGLFRLGHGYVEKFRIEFIVILEKTAVTAIGFPRRQLVRVIKGFHIPALSRHLSNRIFSPGNILPERFHIRGAWEPSRYADYGDILIPVSSRVSAMAEGWLFLFPIRRCDI